MDRTKQHITTEQLNELSDKGKEKLRKWWNPQDGDLFTDSNWCSELIWKNERSDDSFYSCDKKNKIMRDKNQLFEENEGNPEDNQDTVYDVYPLLSIGQMIEFLGEGYFNVLCDGNSEVEWICPTKELCDVLWQAVKTILEE